MGLFGYLLIPVSLDTFIFYLLIHDFQGDCFSVGSPLVCFLLYHGICNCSGI